MTAPEHPDDKRIEQYTLQVQQMRDAAKQLTSLGSVLPTFYFAVLSFSDLRKTVAGWEALPFLLPTLPWLVSVVLAAHIPLPLMLPPQERAARAERLKEISATYHTRLHRAYWCLVCGLALLLIVLGYYLVAVPAPR